MNPIVYINGTPLSDSVFTSHIYTYLNQLRKRDIPFSVISLTEDAASSEKLCQENRDLLRKISDAPVVFEPQPSPTQGPRRLLQSMRRALSRSAQSSKQVIFHANSYLTGYLLLKALGTKRQSSVLVDFKGILPQECLYYDPVNFPMRFGRYLFALHMEKYICKNADGITVVSNKFKKWVQKNRGFGTKPIWVIPSCVDIQKFYFDPSIRTQTRKELQLGDSPTVGYCGSLRSWQLPDTMFQFFQILYRKRKDTRFLFLSHFVEEAKNRFRSSGIPEISYVATSASGERLARLLMACDAGVLFRKRDIVNIVASPTKFGEYMRCGLGVFATQSIGDYSQLLRKKGFGYVFSNALTTKDLEQTADWFLANYKILRAGSQERSQWAGKRLGWEKNMKKLIQAYQTLSC